MGVSEHWSNILGVLFIRILVLQGVTWSKLGSPNVWKPRHLGYVLGKLNYRDRLMVHTQGPYFKT